MHLQLLVCFMLGSFCSMLLLRGMMPDGGEQYLCMNFCNA